MTRNTALGVPAAAQIVSKASSAASTTVSRRLGVAERGNAANREAGLLAHEVGVGAHEAFADDLAEPAFIDPADP